MFGCQVIIIIVEVITSIIKDRIKCLLEEEHLTVRVNGNKHLKVSEEAGVIGNSYCHSK
jgi:hypothetical protein